MHCRKPHDDKEQDNMGMEKTLALKPLACRGVASCLNKSDQGERRELFVLCADIGISCLEIACDSKAQAT